MRHFTEYGWIVEWPSGRQWFTYRPTLSDDGLMADLQDEGQTPIKIYKARRVTALIRREK